MIRPNHDPMVETEKCEADFSVTDFAFMPFAAGC
jgi:hypothetical protein